MHHLKRITFLCVGKRETTSESSRIELCAERGTGLRANREVISSCILIRVEDTFDGISRNVTHYIFSKVRRNKNIFFGRRLNFFEMDLTDGMRNNRV